MSPWAIVLILGIVEGLTEFIPVSSTGHLLIAEHLLGTHQSDLFNIVIQCGAVIAVIPLFWHRIEALLHLERPSSRDFALKIAVAFLGTGAIGFVLEKRGWKLPETVQPIAWALILGGIIFILVEAWMKKRSHSDDISWAVVFIVVVGQLIAAIFPGASRSGSTIILAMVLGCTRPAATEFSFLVGIPTMLAAGGYKIFKALHEGQQENWSLLAIATVASAIVSFIAVKWLLRYVQTHTFVSFGIYRIIVGIILLAVFGLHG